MAGKVAALRRSGLDEYVADGRVTARRQSALPLTVYDYTPKTAYGRLWDEVTLAHRGLVRDDAGRVVLHCLPKFFGVQEHEAFEDLPPLPGD